MIAAGVVCQTTSHNGYGWCVTLLTLLAIRAQGQNVDEPWTPNVKTLEDKVMTVEGASLITPEPQELPTRKSSQPMSREGQTQSTTPADDPWCE